MAKHYKDYLVEYSKNITETKSGMKVPIKGERAVDKQAVDTRLGHFTSSHKYSENYNINPDELADRKGLDIYSYMLNDDQINANSKLKKISRLSTELTIQAASNDPEDVKIAEFVNYTLRDQMQISLRDLNLNLLSSMDYGFSIAEKNFQYIDDGKWEGYIGYKNINPKSPVGFMFDLDDYGDIRPKGVVQNIHTLPLSYLSRKQKEELPRYRRDKFVIMSHMAPFNNPYGQSDLRSSYRSWISKDIIMKLWSMYLERHGAPLPMGTLPLGATPEEADELRSVLDTLQGKSVITLPEGFEVEYLESERTAAPGFEEAIAIHNGALDRSAIVPQLMGLSGGQGTGGSYGLGKTQYDVFIFYEEYLGLQLEEIYHNQIIKPIVDLNFSDVEEYPRLQFESIRRETRKERMDIIKLAIDSGVITELGPWIYTFIGLPIPRSSMPEPGTKIEIPGTNTVELDDDRANRLTDPDERSVVDGTNPYVDKSEVDGTNS